MADKDRITLLLTHIRDGDNQAYNELFSTVYDHLRDIARHHISHQQFGKQSTFSKTALVHEAYIKLLDYTDGEWKNRAHFYAIASRCMRHILVDYSRKKLAGKRGGGQHHLTLHEEEIDLEKHAEHLIELDRLIDEMAQFDERKSKVVEMRFFSGMSIPEIAEVLNISTRTVDREWLKARVWLLKELK
jgi:RNA polymerase sigma factor (TIGR02999 family)